MVAQIDEATVAAAGIEIIFGHRAGEPTIRSARTRWLSERATSQVSSCASRACAINAWIAGSDTTRSPNPKEIGAKYLVGVSLIPTRTIKSLSETWSWLVKRSK